MLSAENKIFRTEKFTMRREMSSQWSPLGVFIHFQVNGNNSILY